MQSKLNDRDALLDIVSETYWNVDAYLKENGRDNIGAYIRRRGLGRGLVHRHASLQVDDTRSFGNGSLNSESP